MLIKRFLGKAIPSVFLASLALTLTPVIAHAESSVESTTPPVAAPKDSSISALSVPQGEKRYIVKYKDHVDAVAESALLSKQGMDVKTTLSHSIKASVVVASSTEIASLSTSHEVETIELDQPVSITAATSIWGLDRIDQRTGRDGQYNTGDEGVGVNVYVVDSGMYPGHTEFTGRVPMTWSGIYDGRGANDCNGHGTHVSGTVAGTTYGVAKRANIIPVRVLECDGSGWSSTIVAGLDWIVAHHPAGQPAVVNMSVGGFTSASLDQSVRNVINDGITVVAAAGNSNVDACSSAPASVVPAITVAATDINDMQASFSNYGSCVDIQAPGVSIRSAYNNAPTGYNTLSGTSMAAPHVAGAAAVMLSRNRSLNPAQVHQAIIDNATVGVIGGNKGLTPNRMLFIPPLYSASPVSCSNLKLGDAWAGVGTTCNLQSQAQTESAPSAPLAGVINSAGMALNAVLPDVQIKGNPPVERIIVETEEDVSVPIFKNSEIAKSIKTEISVRRKENVPSVKVDEVISEVFTSTENFDTSPIQAVPQGKPRINAGEGVMASASTNNISDEKLSDLSSDTPLRFVLLVASSGLLVFSIVILMVHRFRYSPSVN